MTEEITWETLLKAYANGYFPMAENAGDPELHWFYPETRGIIPLDKFHVPKSLAKLVKKNPFTLTIDKAFPEVIEACRERSEETWINETIVKLYCRLWEKGFAHSVECWRESRSADRGSPERCSMGFSAENPGSDLILVGGLYGVALGGAFFGESMFSRESGASKIALVHLVELLKNANYTLLDTQFVNDHLKQFGVIEIPREEYLKLLEKAIREKPKSLCQ